MIRERGEQAELEYRAASDSSDYDDNYVYDYEYNEDGGGGWWQK